MRKRILFTGATGYLGSRLAKAMVKDNYELLVIKRRSSNLYRINSIVPHINFLDIEDLYSSDLIEVTKNIDAIVHVATCYGRSNETINEIFSVNTEFPLRLLEAGSRSGVKIFLNTDTALNKYLNSYALSKHQLYQWGKYLSIHKKIKFANLRLEHFYGPNDDATKFVTHVIKSCIANLPDLKLTLGEQKRDFIFIDDVVSAYMHILELSNDIDESFIQMDVGSGQSVSIRMLVEAIHAMTESRTHLNFGAIPYREGEVMRSEADTSQLNALGWRCQYDLAAGLKISIEEEKNKL